MMRPDASRLLLPLTFRDGSSLPARIIPGPMESVTDGVWISQLTARGWVQCWWTPFLRISTGVPRLPRLREWLAQFIGTGLPVIAQIMGRDTALLAEAAHRIFLAGATAVDLNCACPSHAVTANRSGGFCLKSPEWIAATLRKIRQAVGTRPIGVKVRTGWSSPTEFGDVIAPAIREANPDFVTVHFRTVAEGYSAVPDGLERLAAAREALPGQLLVGSGDLFTPEDVVDMALRCGVDAVAPARGLLRNPRLIAETQELLRGGECRPIDETTRRSFLEGCVRDGAPRGFVLQMAANMYGKQSPQFREWLSCGFHSQQDAPAIKSSAQVAKGV